MRSCRFCGTEISDDRNIGTKYCDAKCRIAAHRKRESGAAPGSPRFCSFVFCRHPHYARGWCNKHWTAWRRYGDPLANYQNAHRRVIEKRGPAREHHCKWCGKPAISWAYIHGSLGEFRTEKGTPFSMDANDYQAMCDLCHGSYDRANGKVQGGQAHRRARHEVIPGSMTERVAWVRADGKRPIMPDGRPASSTNAETWRTYPEVLNGAGDGFGIMLGDGLGCYDLDHVTDDQAREFIASIPESIIFTERSMSGNGVHVFIEAPMALDYKRTINGISVERYTAARFIRVTGHAFTL